VHHE
jgi:hypothetical protein